MMVQPIRGRIHRVLGGDACRGRDVERFIQPWASAPSGPGRGHAARGHQRRARAGPGGRGLSWAPDRGGHVQLWSGAPLTDDLLSARSASALAGLVDLGIPGVQPSSTRSTVALALVNPGHMPVLPTTTAGVPAALPCDPMPKPLQRWRYQVPARRGPGACRWLRWRPRFVRLRHGPVVAPRGSGPGPPRARGAARGRARFRRSRTSGPGTGGWPRHLHERSVPGVPIGVRKPKSAGGSVSRMTPGGRAAPLRPAARRTSPGPPGWRPRPSGRGAVGSRRYSGRTRARPEPPN